MSEPSIQGSTGPGEPVQAPEPQNKTKFTTTEITLALILGIGIVVFFIWCVPSYKEVKKSSEEKDKTIATLTTENEKYKNSALNRTTYYSNGRIKSKTIYSTTEGSSERSNSNTVTTGEKTNKESTIIKRGTTQVGVFAGIQKDFMATFEGDCLLGPFGLGLAGYEANDFKQWSVLGGLKLGL